MRDSVKGKVSIYIITAPSVNHFVYLVIPSLNVIYVMLKEGEGYLSDFIVKIISLCTLTGVL